MTDLTVVIHPALIAVHGAAVVLDAIGLAATAQQIPHNIAIQIRISEDAITDPQQLAMSSAVLEALRRKRGRLQ